MYREPAFMRDLHRRQAREYERTKSLSLHEFVRLLEERAQRALRKWGLKEMSSKNGARKIVSTK